MYLFLALYSAPLIRVGWRGGSSYHKFYTLPMKRLKSSHWVFALQCKQPNTLAIRKYPRGIFSTRESLCSIFVCPAFSEEDKKLLENLMALSVHNFLVVSLQYYQWSRRSPIFFPGWCCPSDCVCLAALLWGSLSVPLFPSERGSDVFVVTAPQCCSMDQGISSLSYFLFVTWLQRTPWEFLPYIC